MPDSQANNIKQQLDRKYDLICNKAYEVSEKTFFIGIADYVAISSDNLLINDILLKTVISERDREQDKVTAAEERTLQELNHFMLKITKYARREHIDNKEFIKAINDYTNFLSRVNQTDQPLPRALFHCLREAAEVIQNLGDKKYKRYINHYFMLDSDGNTIWKFAPSLKEFDKEKKHLDDEMQIAVWGSWNDLAIVFNLFFRAEEVEKERYSSRDKVFEALSWYALMKERNNIMTGNKNDQSAHLNIDYYRHHLWRVHNHFLDELSRYGQQSKEVTNKNQPSPEEVTTVKDLFAIADNPPRIRYLGKAKVTEDIRKWKKLRGKTQVFAILDLAAEKYRRNRATNSTPFIKLSFEDIRTRLNDRNYCDNPPNWQSAPSPARLLSTLLGNIQEVLPFTPKELEVETTEGTSFLTFPMK